MAKKPAKKSFSIFNFILILNLLVIVTLSLVAASSYNKYQALSREVQVLTFKNNATNAELYNLYKCVALEETNCPTDKYNNSSKWKSEIDKLLAE